MPIAMIILNILLVALLLAIFVGGHLYAMATQHRDHGAVATGPVLRRRVWSERRRWSRPVRIERRRQSALRSKPWPAA
jgi:cytochrome b subunit of formate dehydrogenase